MIPPIYDKFKRNGCWLCPKQSKESLQILYQEYPDLWKKLKEYEKDSPHGFKVEKTLAEYELDFLDKKPIINNLKFQRTVVGCI
ncbi:MAG: hypothetical protein DRH37_04100 [Deltaproteobacteria bacterium]|nr:MAG: hypothetical protein DRH37_04100 [Deltaproteobacteria bacterium]